VRSAGRAAALALPEPLAGAVPRDLARRWLAAASAVDGDPIGADEVVARWLEMVAALLAVRRSARRAGR
jgi:hypothetical protein